MTQIKTAAFVWEHEYAVHLVKLYYQIYPEGQKVEVNEVRNQSGEIIIFSINTVIGEYEMVADRLEGLHTIYSRDPHGTQEMIKINGRSSF